MSSRLTDAEVVAVFHKVAKAMEPFDVDRTYHAVCLETAASAGCSYKRVHDVCLTEDLPEDECE